MIQECVVDKDLICKDIENCTSCVKEGFALSGILHGVLYCHHKLAVNNDIKIEYIKNLSLCHESVKEMMSDIIYREDFLHEVNNTSDNISIDKAEKIDQTPLKEKMCYIHAADQISFRKIISTKDYIDGIQPEHHALLKTEILVDFIEVCKVKLI